LEFGVLERDTDLIPFLQFSQRVKYPTEIALQPVDINNLSMGIFPWDVLMGGKNLGSYGEL